MPNGRGSCLSLKVVFKLKDLSSISSPWGGNKWKKGQRLTTRKESNQKSDNWAKLLCGDQDVIRIQDSKDFKAE